MSNENKKGFVSALETALIMYSREKLAKVEYKQRDFAEAVVITFTNGHTKAVNVTGDSCIAIMHDLWRALQ